MDPKDAYKMASMGVPASSHEQMQFVVEAVPVYPPPPPHAGGMFYPPSAPVYAYAQQPPQYVLGPAAAGYPQHPPQQQQHLLSPYGGISELPPADGVLKLTYLRPDCGADCYHCCCCCWFLPPPQPESHERFKIEIDGVEVATIKQCSVSSWPVKAGTHTVKVKKAGVAGFFHRIVGSDEVTSAVLNVHPGQTKAMVLGRHLTRCSNFRIVFLEDEHEFQQQHERGGC